ncbi:MAG: 30S ribosomal protein S3 [Candidatus Nealsonbacteria bacterium]|nr:MAG: 30S ribosomal protein S3 [Candidatus Nealsonbacteria bacterium]
MSHKVHPKAFRIREIKDWDSRGFYEKNFASYLKEDFEIREFIKKKIKKFGLGKIEIERSPGKINIIIFTARPGLVIGRAGEGVERLIKELRQKILKTKAPYNKRGGIKLDSKIEIREIKNIWLSALLVAQLMAAQIEKRMPYRRVLKKTLSKIMSQKGAKGARLEVAGRLNGISIARREWLQKGLLPRQTLRADIDYARDTAFCSYGAVGIKVWIYKGEKF